MSAATPGLPALDEHARRVLRNTSSQAALLCYHSIADPGWPFLSIPPDRFERQLATLRRRGWASGTVATLDAIAGGARLERPTAFLTFDDGYVDNYTTAFPLLREHGFTALIFIVPPLVDAGAPLRWRGVEAPCEQLPDVWRSMTWEMVEEMAEAGIEFGAHTLTHPSLPDVSDEQLRDELVDSRRRVAERLGACDTLAYPYGHEDARVRAAARDAGFRWAFTIPRGGQDHLGALAIPRVAVDHLDDERRFALKLRPLARRALLAHPGSPARVALSAAKGTLGRVRRG